MCHLKLNSPPDYVFHTDRQQAALKLKPTDGRVQSNGISKMTVEVEVLHWRLLSLVLLYQPGHFTKSNYRVFIHVVAITESPKLFLTCSIPNVELDLSIAGKERYRLTGREITGINFLVGVPNVSVLGEHLSVNGSEDGLNSEDVR